MNKIHDDIVASNIDINDMFEFYDYCETPTNIYMICDCNLYSKSEPLLTLYFSLEDLNKMTDEQLLCLGFPENTIKLLNRGIKNNTMA